MDKSSANLYRRHGRRCRGGHKEGSFSGEFEERKKGWKRCDCPIVVSGSFDGKFERRNLKVTDWEQAREAVKLWRETRQPPTTPPPAQQIQPSGARRIRIEETAELFLKHHHDSAAGTLRKYRHYMEQWKRFSATLGYAFLDQWTSADVRAFRDSWPRSMRSSNTKLGQFKTFFRYCVAQEWITTSPAERVANLGTLRGQRAARCSERVPFSDEELERMFVACQTRYNSDRDHRFRFSGQDVSDFIAVSVYTGMRISDVATFNISRMSDDGSIEIRQTKTGKKVFTWVPGWLQERIRVRALTFGPQIFGSIPSGDINWVTQLWRDRLKRLWKLCGPWAVTPTPHRFRHTFSRILLQKPGITVRDVAELLGNTEEVVRSYYAAWVPERQERLTKILQAAFEERPRPENVLAFPEAKNQ